VRDGKEMRGVGTMYNEEKGEKEQWLLLLGVAGMIDSKKQVEEEEFD